MLEKQMPVIIDTDFGYDPDDAVALHLGLSDPSVSILGLLTNDEVNIDRRAQILSQCFPKKNIPIFAGIDLGNNNLMPLAISSKRSGYIKAVADSVELLQKLSDAHGTYVCIGALSNLAWFINHSPELLQNVTVYVMGGAFNYRIPGGVEHNIRMDVRAAKTVFTKLKNVYWMLSDHTFNPAIEIAASHWYYQQLQKLTDLPFYEVVKANFDEFFIKKYSSSMMHDPLTLSCVANNFVTFQQVEFSISEFGHFKHLSDESSKTDQHGLHFISTAVNYVGFNQFVEKILKM